MRQIAVIVLFCLGLLFLTVAAPAWAEGPSFDCANAATPVEKAICASGDLSALDRQVAEEYKAALAAGVVTVADQRAWVVRRDKLCAPENALECLRQVLLDRHAFLTERPKVTAYKAGKEESVITIEGGEHSVRFIRDAKDFEAFREGFNQYASYKTDAPRVIKCERMVADIPKQQIVRIMRLKASVCDVWLHGRLIKAMACYVEKDDSFPFGVSEIGEGDVSERDLAVFAGTKC